MSCRAPVAVVEQVLAVQLQQVQEVQAGTLQGILHWQCMVVHRLQRSMALLILS